MSDDYDQRAQELESRLPDLQSKFQELRSTQTDDQLSLQGDLAAKTLTAIATLKKFAQLLDGEFKPSNPPPELQTTLKELDSTWEQTETTSEACLDNINTYSANIVQFHDAALGDWQNQAKTLQDQLQASLTSTEQACDTERATLQTLQQTQRDAESAVNTLQQKLHDAQHKYDDADTYTWIFPPARAVLEILKPIIEACTHDLEGATNAVNAAITQVNDAQGRVRDQEAKVQQLSDLAAKQSGLISQGLSLINECTGIVEETENTEKEIARIKKTRFDAWQLAAKCVNRAEQADFALFKADYATSILQVIDVALVDHTLIAPLAEIVQDLADHDDSSNSVHDITTDDHPDGLLAAVQKKLQESETDGAVPAPPASLPVMMLSSFTPPSAELPPHARPGTSSLAVAHLRLLRSVATALATPQGTPGCVSLSEEEKEKVFAMLRLPVVSANRVKLVSILKKG
jgi:vacuolar-type H+-ATPase subunit I/STV1